MRKKNFFRIPSFSTDLIEKPPKKTEFARFRPSGASQLDGEPNFSLCGSQPITARPHSLLPPHWLSDVSV
ncbi:hypothetical protein NQZ68_011081 [Dissostichus eleginoides]|nr:hypothetical protein NQZ68_011081 [Dissostichus eleginoides]